LHGSLDLRIARYQERRDAQARRRERRFDAGVAAADAMTPASSSRIMMHRSLRYDVLAYLPTQKRAKMRRANPRWLVTLT